MSPLVLHLFSDVSIHAPARGATGRQHHDRRLCMVSIHAPARGATKSLPRFWAMRGCFNPRAREGRDTRTKLQVTAIKCFNPRAREGRDCGEYPHAGRDNVSIHAPARGATWLAWHTCRSWAVSIHAPARGATFCRFRLARVTEVSIHAPARGATIIFLQCPAG